MNGLSISHEYLLIVSLSHLPALAYQYRKTSVHMLRDAFLCFAEGYFYVCMYVSMFLCMYMSVLMQWKARALHASAFIHSVAASHILTT